MESMEQRTGQRVKEMNCSSSLKGNHQFHHELQNNETNVRDADVTLLMPHVLSLTHHHRDTAERHKL
jgi:hypothetical protein